MKGSVSIETAVGVAGVDAPAFVERCIVRTTAVQGWRCSRG